MTILARMQLITAGQSKVLAGHSNDGDSVLVLRRINDIDYALHELPVSDAHQTLRSILAADQAEHAELVTAILETASRPIKKPRKRRTPATAGKP